MRPLEMPAPVSGHHLLAGLRPVPGTPPQSFFIPQTSLCFLSPGGGSCSCSWLNCDPSGLSSNAFSSFVINLTPSEQFFLLRCLYSNNWVGLCLPTAASLIEERRMDSHREGRDRSEGSTQVFSLPNPWPVCIPRALSCQPGP